MRPALLQVVDRQPGAAGDVVGAAALDARSLVAGGFLGVGAVEGDPATERPAHRQAQGHRRAVVVAAHEGDAPAQGFDVVAAAAGSAVVNEGAFAVLRAEIEDAVPELVMALDGLVLGNAGAGQARLGGGPAVKVTPGSDRVGVVVFAVEVHPVLAHHLRDARQDPLQTFGVSQVDGVSVPLVVGAPLRLEAVVFDHVVEIADALGFEPGQDLHPLLVAGLVGLEERLARPFDGIHDPGAHGFVPIPFFTVSPLVEVPAGVEPAEVGDDSLINKTLQGSFPGIEAFGDGSVGVGQARVPGEIGRREWLDVVPLGIGLGHIVFQEPLAPEVGRVVPVPALVGELHDQGRADLFSRKEGGFEADTVAGGPAGLVFLAGEFRPPGPCPAQGHQRAAVPVDQVEIREMPVCGAAACGSEAHDGVPE